MIRSGLVVIFLFLLYGCATPYQKSGLGGGYSETHLRENEFKVSFQGNDSTSDEKINDFVLLRSAELTLDNGYKYFFVTQPGYISSLDHKLTNSIKCYNDGQFNEDYRHAMYDADFILKSIVDKYNIS